MSWLDKLFGGVKSIQVNGVALPQESIANFVGGVTGADDPLNGRTTITVGTIVPGSGAAVSGALGTLTTTTQTILISLATQDTSASLPSSGLFDGLTYVLQFSAGAALAPKKCTIYGNNAAPGSGNIDSSINTNEGLVGFVQVSNTGTMTITWNASLSYWIQS